MYIYENHLGGFYSSEEELSYDETYCETCGDSDWPIGCVDTAEDFIKILANEIEYPPGIGGYDLVYILNFVYETFDDVTITKEEAIDIIMKARGNGNES